MAIPTSEAFARALHDAGIVPDPARISRIVITAEPGSVVRVDVGMFGDEKTLAVVTRELADGLAQDTR